MARLELSGFDELDELFNRIGNIPEDVTERALEAMGKVAAKKVRESGERYGVRDPESDVHILDKIKAQKAKKTPGGGYVDITFTGTRERNGKKVRNAEIAFVNEYGSRKQDARPFVGWAMKLNEKAIVDPAAEIIGDWIENESKK